MSAVVVIDEAALAHMFTRSDGPVAKALTTPAIIVVRVAKRLVAVDTGYLRGSIGWTLVIIDGLLAALIGSNVNYALAQEVGTWKMHAHPFLRPALTFVLGRLAPA